METNHLRNFIHFLAFLKNKRATLYQEYKREEELKVLMHKSKVTTMFQPILSLKEGSTEGFEVLNRPESTVHFPTTETFYDYVGESSYVVMVEQFLRNLSIERFAEQIKKQNECRNPLVFLNIQTQVLADPCWRSGITMELLEKHNLSPNQIVLELTEKQSVKNYHQFKELIEHYRQQGFRIAVDDAGTGYNSLQTLVYLKPEFIKLDKSLIRNIHCHRENQHLVRLLVKYALQVGTKLIAEGIETDDELEFLQNLGVHFGQGYALGRPMPELQQGSMPKVSKHHQLALTL
ncbi:EAL domain-containing protein [Fredinandcohnia sp. QZ13]|uniref:EAL domain-containing protein n=1 Tax=Fredinandcohnia sp. QZ13 TaxID=3073144 RepID=UPI002853564D|nr:EAL domain-containing protein [Fredinandcohnia sp. QZ13]MDR4888075.1 EAL domain-containing protein [Fredinandcohnia sp. QZ13]